MLKTKFTGQFKRDYKLAVKRGCQPAELEKVVSFLVNEQSLPEKYRDHSLADSKYYRGVRECHIQPDWLLIYKIYEDTLILELIRTGSHSDLF